MKYTHRLCCAATVAIVRLEFCIELYLLDESGIMTDGEIVAEISFKDSTVQEEEETPAVTIM